MRLLPTPRTTDHHGPGRHGDGGLDLRTAIASHAGGVSTGRVATPDETQRGGHSVNLQDVAEHEVRQSNLPTVTANEFTKSATTVYKRGNPSLTAAVLTREDVDWGPYEQAIRRWERILGRPAPPPVKNDGRNGKARLNPELTEWMMGWPAGWVTDPSLGLSREQQLKACGNGVVPQQAESAIRELLAREGVPSVR